MRLFAHRHAHAAPRAHLLSALGVALAAVGCAPPGPRLPASATEGLRRTISLPASSASSATVPISYLASGLPGSTRLILVHGTPGSATAWADYLLEPPAGAEVLALDRPGFGQSGPEGAMPRLADQAAAAAALLPTDGRPVILLGHSLGGAVVAQVAADLSALAPERIQAIVLLAASLDPSLESIHPMQRLGAWAPLRNWLPRSLRNANAELMALKPELEALALRLPTIRTQVILVHGTRDELVPVENVAFLQARLSGARCVKTVLLEGRNHFLPWNSEPAVREAIQMALEATC